MATRRHFEEEDEEDESGSLLGGGLRPARPGRAEEPPPPRCRAVTATLFALGITAGYAAVRAFEAPAEPPPKPASYSSDSSGWPKSDVGPFDLDSRAGLRRALAARGLTPSGASREAGSSGREIVLFTSDVNGLPAAANLALQLKAVGILHHLVLAESRATCASAARPHATRPPRGNSAREQLRGNSTLSTTRLRGRVAARGEDARPGLVLSGATLATRTGLGSAADGLSGCPALSLDTATHHRWH